MFVDARVPLRFGRVEDAGPEDADRTFGHFAGEMLGRAVDDLATALDDTRDAVTRIRMDLPQNIQEPVISKIDIGGSQERSADPARGDHGVADTGGAA